MTGSKRERTAENSKALRDTGGAGRRERLKERLLREGAGSFSEGEILELLLTFAIPRRDVKPLAAQLSAGVGSLQVLLSSSVLELTSVAGVSKHAAALIRLVGEILGRCSEPSLPQVEILKHPQELEQYLLSRMRPMKDEKIFLIFFDHQGIVLGEDFVGAGTIDQAVLFPRQIMELALRCNASALIVVHSHPHGPPLPSVQDREEAERLREILRPFDITLEDSIVVGRTKCFSIFKNAPL